MRTREKVIILIVAATLILGSVIFFTFRDNEVEANYFRWLFSTNLKYGLSSPSKFLSDELPEGTFLYGGLTIFAALMFILFLKMTHDSELRALRRRLSDLRSEKNETDNLLQEVVWKGKHEQQAKDSVTRDLEASIEKIESLLGELNNKEEQLRARDVELITLKSNSLSQAESGPARTPSDRLLREELKNKNELLQSKTAAFKDLEQRMSAKTRLWENELRERDALVKSRDAELENLRDQIADLNGRVQESETARKRADDLLQTESRKTKEVLEANNLAILTEEKRLTDKIKGLENQLGEKDKLLRTRDTELDGFRQQLSELESARDQTAAQLQDELGKAEQDRRAKEHLISELEQRLSAHIHALKNEVGEKNLLLQARDGEVKSLKSEVKAISLRLTEMAAAKVRAEEALQEELKKEKWQREAEQTSYREREDHYEKEASLLTQRLGEKEVALERSVAEFEALRQEMHAVSLRFDGAMEAKERAEGLLREALSKDKLERESREARIHEMEQRHAQEVQTLHGRLGEKDDSLKKHGEEIKSLKAKVASLAEQLSKVGAAKERAAVLLQQKLRSEKVGLQANDSALREIEEGFNAKMASLQEQLAAKQDLVENRDKELTALKSNIASLNQKMTDLAAAKARAESLFEDALKEKTDLLQSKDVGAKIVEEELTGKIRGLENRLRETEALLRGRESELSSSKHQAAELIASKDQGARLLHEELRQKSELLDAKETAIKTLEERFGIRVQALESELGEKQELLDARDQELKGLMAKVNALSGDLTDLGTAKDHALRLLQEDVKQKSEMLSAKESAMAALEERLKSKARALENELSQKQELLTARDTELDALMSKVSELAEKLSERDADRERSDRLLQEELREKTALLQSRETSIDELEERVKGRAEALERQLAEKQKLLEANGAELSDLRSQFNSLTIRLNEAELANVRLEGLLQIERTNTDKALVAVSASEEDGDAKLNGESQALETLLSEREQLLHARDKLIQDLMTELKEKKTQLARQEIEVWQKIERREAWKHRLSKFGIRMKD
jgi:DNA repair exonuclease SbcCD ATPase subunit